MSTASFSQRSSADHRHSPCSRPPHKRPARQRIGNALRAGGALLLAGMGLFAATGTAAQAQDYVQRSFINLGFEKPDLPPTCGANGWDGSAVLPAQDVPGWETTHVPMEAWCRADGSYPAGTHPLIDIWKTGRVDGIPARAGKQMAELNALAESRIYQTICLLNGDEVEYRLSHRARQQQAERPNGDTMIFKISTEAGADFRDLFQASTDHNGTSTDLQCHNGVASHQCNTPAQVGVWTDYSGSFTWEEPSGKYQFGFEARDTAGYRGGGNVLDEIQLEGIIPFVEFHTDALSSIEGNTNPELQLRVSGLITQPMQVRLRVTDNEATLGDDYTAQGFG